MNAMQSLVLGGTGMVGRHVVDQLITAGERPFVLSRAAHDLRDVIWIRGDLAHADAIAFSTCQRVLCTAPPALLLKAIPSLAKAGAQRIVFLSTTSVITKANSADPDERALVQTLADIERKVSAACEAHGVGWTVLRPTMIYDEGRDSNVSRIARLAKKFGFFPLSGRGAGLRQPVHAQDLAAGMLQAAASEATRNKTYNVPGGETLTYREMVGRIFDGLDQPRRIIAVPPLLWRLALSLVKTKLPHVNAAMGERMAKDLVFDASPAANDFGWKPRDFHPRFDGTM